MTQEEEILDELGRNPTGITVELENYNDAVRIEAALRRHLRWIAGTYKGTGMDNPYEAVRIRLIKPRTLEVTLDKPEYKLRIKPRPDDAA